MTKHRCGRDPAKERSWRRAINRWGRSDLTIRAFCKQEQRSEWSFHWWRRELARRDRSESESAGNHNGSRSGDRAKPGRPRLMKEVASPSFLPVRVASSPEPFLPGEAIEVVLPSGHLVRVAAQVDPAALSKVIRVLENRPC